MSELNRRRWPRPLGSTPPTDLILRALAPLIFSNWSTMSHCGIACALTHFSSSMGLAHVKSNPYAAVRSLSRVVGGISYVPI